MAQNRAREGFITLFFWKRGVYAIRQGEERDWGPGSSRKRARLRVRLEQLC